MKLYFSPGACSLSPRIVLLETGLPFTTELVDLYSKRLADGSDYRDINSKGYVPALEISPGQVLTEGPAIVQYLADLAPEKGLAPPAGTLARYELMSMLNFIAAEIHKNYTPLFLPDTDDAVRHAARANLARRYAWLDTHLAGRTYLVGEQFSVADAFLFTVTSWAGFVQLDLSAWPQVAAYQERIGARPAVLQAMREEGLID